GLGQRGHKRRTGPGPGAGLCLLFFRLLPIATVKSYRGQSAMTVSEPASIVAVAPCRRERLVATPARCYPFWSSTGGGITAFPPEEGHGRHRAARVHRAPWRRGGMAARGARAAGRPGTADRRAHAGRRKRSRAEDSPLRVHPSAFGLGL